MYLLSIPDPLPLPEEEKMVPPPDDPKPPPTETSGENRMILVVEKNLSSTQATCDHKGDFALVLSKIEEIQKWCANVHFDHPSNDDTQVLEHLKVVHQDLVLKLSHLNFTGSNDEDKPKGDCLCFWLRQVNPPNEKDDYMLTCPHCTLSRQGQNLLTAAGLPAASFKQYWLPLGRILVCLQTDDDVKLTQIMLQLMPKALSKAFSKAREDERNTKGGKDGHSDFISTVIPYSQGKYSPTACLEGDDDDPNGQEDNIFTVNPNNELMTIASPNIRSDSSNLRNVHGSISTAGPNADPTTVALPAISSVRSAAGIESIYEMLLYFAILWDARRCIPILLKWHKIPRSKIDAIKNRIEENKHKDGPFPSIVNNINHISKSINDSSMDNKIYIDCIFVAAKEKNLEAFKVLLFGPSHKAFPKTAKKVNILNTNEKYGKTIFQFLICLCYDSMKKHGHEEDCFLQMFDYLYEPIFIRRWANIPEDISNPDHDNSTREALHHLLGKDGEVLKYAADNGTSGTLKKILNNPPYRREDEDKDMSSCYLINGMDGILKQLHYRTTKEEIGSLVDVEPLRTIVEDKWAFYRPYYIAWLLASFVYMIIFTMCANWRPIGATSLADMYRSAADYGRLVLEIFVFLGLAFLLYGIFQEWRALQHHVPSGSSGIRRYASWVGHHIPKPYRRYDLYVLVNVIFVALVITVIGMRFSYNPNEDIILSLALFFGWINMVHRVAAFKRFGMFPIIMHHCLMKDFFTGFVWVFLLMLAGLSTATFTVYQTLADQSPSDFPATNFWWTPFSLLKLTFGLLETEYATQTRLAWIGITLFLLYLFFMNIVLFNLLISMLGTTYSRVYDIVDKHWIQIQLSYVLLMERWWLSLKFPNYQHNRCQLWKSKSEGTYEKNGKDKLIFIPKEQSPQHHLIDEVYIM